MIKEKVTQLAFQAQLEVIAILPEHGTEQRAKDILRNVNAAYAHYNNPAGASFKATKMRPIIPVTEVVPPVAGLFRGREVLGGTGGSRPVASSWTRRPIAHRVPLRPQGPATSGDPGCRGRPGGPILTVGRTVFELWLGTL